MPSPRKDSPLSWMQPLSSSVSFCEPSKHVSSSQSSPSADPELIVMLAWMEARDQHIAKYITRYRELFPQARILLARAPITHIFWSRLGNKELGPVVPMLRAAAASEGDIKFPGGNPKGKHRAKVLLHVFSNGGVNNLARILALLRAGSSKTLSMPRHVTVFDSCPGYFHWRSTHAALAQALPRIFSPLVWLLLGLMWLVDRPFGGRPMPDINADAIIAEDLQEKEERRGYIYGSADEMVDWRDVETHAARATEAGFEVVAMEKVEGARHVESMRVDGERYWRVLKEVWDNS